MKYLLYCSILLLTSCSDVKQADTKTSSSSSTYSVDGKKVSVYTTADSTNLRMASTGEIEFQQKGQPFENEISVFVDPTKTYQEFMGIGAALTDASAETFAKLPKDKQQELLTAYFDKEKGIAYSIGRTNIHSCDFSSDTYTYVTDGDKDLKSFNVDHDKKYRIPFIRDVINAAGGKLTLFASPWSPPAWMKDNNDILHGGHLKPDFYQSWANYYAKFIKTYEKEGIPVWGISIQNEPMATQRWESCIYTAEEERDFLKNFLGPTMQKEGLGNKKIIMWDHNRDLIYQRALTYFSDPDVLKYAWGIGFHWYEDWSGGDQMFANLKRVNDAFPDKPLLFTEGCNGPFNLQQISDWKWGERYGKSMINDFNGGAVGWTDWNILLDETGGPNHVQNFCFAPVHADTKTGQLIYMNSYYYIGHFSKFIKPGAKRIIASPTRSQLLTTAFKNPDGTIVVIVMNDKNINSPFNLWINGKAAKANALPHSINTYVIK